MIIEIFCRNYLKASFCFISLVLYSIPIFLDYKFQIYCPFFLEFFLFLFIFSNHILGKVFNFFVLIPWWDSLLHVFGGFLSALVLFGIIHLESSNFLLFFKPFFLFLLVLSFSMMVAVFWEMFEFSGDRLFHLDNQNDFLIHEFSTIEFYKTKTKIPTPRSFENISRTDIYYKQDGKLMKKTISGYLDIGLIDTMKDLFLNLIGALLFILFSFSYVKRSDKGSIITLLLPVKRKDCGK